MLNGIAPILLFRFFKLTPEAEAAVAKIPVLSNVYSKIGLPPIPLYLDEALSGIFIQHETKAVEIDTKIDTMSEGGAPLVTQKALGSTVTIRMVASANSLGVTLLSAMSDLILEKVTSQEYAVSYFHKAIVIFDGLLHSIAIEPRENTDLYDITMTISRGRAEQKKEEVPVVEKTPGTVGLGDGAGAPLVPGPAGPGSTPPGSPVTPPVPQPPPPSFELGGLG